MWGQTNTVANIVKKLDEIKAAAAAKGIAEETVQAWYPQLHKDIARFKARQLDDNSRQIKRNAFWVAREAKRVTLTHNKAQRFADQVDQMAAKAITQDKFAEVKGLRVQQGQWNAKLDAHFKKKNIFVPVSNHRKQQLKAEDKAIASKRTSKWQAWHKKNEEQDASRAKQLEDSKAERIKKHTNNDADAKQAWTDKLQARTKRIQDENAERIVARQKFRNDLQTKYDTENLATLNDHNDYWDAIQQKREAEDNTHELAAARLKRVNRTAFFENFAHGCKKVFYRNGQSGLRLSKEFFQARGRNFARASTWLAYQARECFETIATALYRPSENVGVHVGKGTEIVGRHIKQASRFVADEASACFRSIATSISRAAKATGMFLAECASTSRRSLDRATTAPIYRLGNTITDAAVAIKRGFQDADPVAARERSVEEELLISDKDKEIIEGKDTEQLGIKFRLFQAAPVDIDDALDYSNESDEGLGIAGMLNQV
jgi:hypothetical protein